MTSRDGKSLKTITVVSTYPKTGSKNIGDELITESLVRAIRHVGGEVEIRVVSRMDDWSSVSKHIDTADHILFACLAIRPEMHRREYPWLHKGVESGVPLSAISAGTSLLVDQRGEGLFSGISKETMELLRRFNKGVTVLTTRGVLTQKFCEHHGLDKAIFTGDVAFYDPRFDQRIFEEARKVRNVVVSDPHRPDAYLPVMDRLLELLPILFSDARIAIAQHGVGSGCHRLGAKHGIPVIEVFKDLKNGLELYDQTDLHVGFRVHAHVSALKRRKYSYLLEQDGRGYEYGLTLDRKISVAAIANGALAINLRNIAKVFKIGMITFDRRPHVVVADQLLSMISADKRLGFSRFSGLERQIHRFNEDTLSALKRIF